MASFVTAFSTRTTRRRGSAARKSSARTRAERERDGIPLDIETRPSDRRQCEDAERFASIGIRPMSADDSHDVASVRPNAVRARLRAGASAFGVMAFEFFTPGLAPCARRAGADFVLLDMEHSGVSIDTIKAQIAFAHGVGIVPMVRVPTCAITRSRRCSMQALPESWRR